MSSSSFRCGTFPAFPALRFTIVSALSKFSPNSSFMSITNALISVESAIAISSCIRFGLCDAQRFTYSARTICESSANDLASVSGAEDEPLWLLSDVVEAAAGVCAGCWATAVLFPSLAPQAASVRKRRGMLRM